MFGAYHLIEIEPTRPGADVLRLSKDLLADVGDCYVAADAQNEEAINESTFSDDSDRFTVRLDVATGARVQEACKCIARGGFAIVQTSEHNAYPQ